MIMRFIDSVIITNVCPFCGKEHNVEVSESAFYEWQSGALIQNAMPTLSATEREQLISHICPTCQDKLFGEDPEEDEDERDDISTCMRESLEFTGQWW
jgi:uncharacterized Zn finger protein (UPF0148 family)